MKKILHLLFLALLFQACSVFKPPTPIEPVIEEIPQLNIENAIIRSVNMLLAEQWLSDYLMENNTRPTIAVSTITNKTKATVKSESIYDNIDLNLMRSGQVRVIKTNAEQRNSKPGILAKGQSIDYALSVSIEKKEKNNTFRNTFILSLWDDKSTEPVATVDIEIE